MLYEKTVVKKPWGYEYLAYENEHVALWFLYIDSGQSTSMHCHPNKTTGLMLVDGNVQVSFISNTNDLKPGQKLMIRKGLFHSTDSNKVLAPNCKNFNKNSIQQHKKYCCDRKCFKTKSSFSRIIKIF